MRAIMLGLRASSAIAALMLAACSSLSVPMNEPLRSAGGNTEYRLLDVNRLGGAEKRSGAGGPIGWIHLMDGGISDNLALRVLLNDVLLMEMRAERFTAGLMPIRRVLVISVDGQGAPNPAWPQQRTVSGLGQIVSAATGAQIGAYNLETLIAIEHTVDDFIGRLRRLRCGQTHVIFGYPCGDVTGKVLRVSLSDYDEPETRARLLAIRTGLTLPRNQVDELVAAGEAMIRHNAEAITGFLEPGPQPAIMAPRR
jgi:hypothetical protein